MSNIIIGVDPGAKTGIAAVDVSDSQQPRILALTTLAHNDPIMRPTILGLAIMLDARVVIERAEGHIYQRRGANAAAMRKIAANVGQNRERAEEIARMLRQCDIYVTLRKPVRGGTKWTAEKFAAVFGWRGRSSSHSRDAAVIAIGGER